MPFVADFHRAFGLPIERLPTTLLPENLKALRVRLLVEEVAEFAVAVSEGDVVALADALGDIVYVAYGAALSFGIELDAVVAEVHRANMSKLDDDGAPILREDGKVLKSNRYRSPDVANVLTTQPPLPWGLEGVTPGS